MIKDTYLHGPPPFNGPIFMTPPFSAVSKSCDPTSVSTPPPPLPLLISDNSLSLNRSFVFYVAGHSNAHNDITLCIRITPGLQHWCIPYLPHTLGVPSPLYFFFDAKHLM